MVFNIWIACTGLGVCIGLLYSGWVLDTLKLHWTISILSSAGIFLVSGILVVVFVPEKNLENKESQLSLGERTCKILATIKAFYQRKGSNVILLFEYAVQDNITSILEFWGPYYFMIMGFGIKSVWIAIASYFGQCAGGIIFNPIIKCLHLPVKAVTVFFSFTQALCYFLVYFIEMKEENFWKFILLFTFGLMSFAVPMTRALSTETSERT